MNSLNFPYTNSQEKRSSRITLFILIGLLLILNACGSDDEPEEPEKPKTISADISVSSNTNSILYTDNDDLKTQVNNAITYNYSNALESETDKTISIPADSAQVTVSIDFKAAFKNAYVDPNTSNNTVTISLEKEVVEANAVTLSADGLGNTYDLITSVLAPGENPIETPDCNHAEFGPHIDEVFDSELDAHVFRFSIHTDPDNDRCINFDRQRNEIKTYDKSPDNLLGVENETVVYTWKFKLADGFQSSPNFTHIHQLKSVGGDFASMPMYTLTTRKSSPDRLELRYAETDNQITLKQTDLAPLVGVWLEVTETIKYGQSGTYDISIKQINNNNILFEYSNNDIINWRPAAEFVRPKWGIYRSLLNVQNLRDEEVLYTDFSIEELD